MQITREDFGNEFMERFSEKHQQYIIDFCNTFQRTFPNVIKKQILIQRVSRLKCIVERSVNSKNNGDLVYNDLEMGYRTGQSDKDERNTIYHELLHLLSYHSEEKLFKLRGLFDEGAKFWDESDDSMYQESPMFDEIMNEYYTIKMLEEEGIFTEDEYVLKSPTVTNFSKEFVKYHGNGYISVVQLAELYDKIFGNDLLKAKLYQCEEFRDKFNSKYKNIQIDIGEDKQGAPPFDKIGIQISQDTYGAYCTAIDIWKINELEQVEENGFNLYSYLRRSQELMRYLPVREENGAYGTDRNNNGIPQEIFDKVSQMDREFVCQYLRTDLMQIQDENERNRKINTVLAVVNILRENIHELTEQDIDTVSFSKISQYTHGGKDCLVINTASQDFMTFVNNTDEVNYQFGAYSKFKQLPEFEDFGFTQEHEEQVRTTFREQGVELQEYQYATVMDSGRYGMYSLVKSNGRYYIATGEIEEAQLKSAETLGINPSQIKSASKSENVGLSEINDITKTLRQELETTRENPNIDGRDE